MIENKAGNGDDVDEKTKCKNNNNTSLTPLINFLFKVCPKIVPHLDERDAFAKFLKLNQRFPGKTTTWTVSVCRLLVCPETLVKRKFQLRKDTNRSKMSENFKMRGQRLAVEDAVVILGYIQMSADTPLTLFFSTDKTFTEEVVGNNWTKEISARDFTFLLEEKVLQELWMKNESNVKGKLLRKKRP